MEFVSKKEKGQAWLFGMFVLLTVFTLYTVFLQKVKVEHSVEQVEDILTVSALGGLVIDSKALSLTGE